MTQGKRLIELLPDGGNDVFYNSDFRSIFEYHIDRLVNDPKAAVIEITGGTANQYSGDLNGVLMLNGISPHYHYFVMRCNNFTTPLEYGVEHTSLIIPSLEDLDDLMRIWSSNNK